jgi:hypothetical protein
MRAIRIIGFLLFLSVAVLAAPPEVIVVRGPMVIAFFPPISQADVHRDGNEAPADFQWYLSGLGAI